MFRSIAVSFRVLPKNTSLSPSNINLKLTPLTAKKYQVEFYETLFPSCEKNKTCIFLSKIQVLCNLPCLNVSSHSSVVSIQKPG